MNKKHEWIEYLDFIISGFRAACHFVKSFFFAENYQNDFDNFLRKKKLWFQNAMYSYSSRYNMCKITQFFVMINVYVVQYAMILKLNYRNNYAIEVWAVPFRACNQLIVRLCKLKRVN